MLPLPMHDQGRPPPPYPTQTVLLFFVLLFFIILVRGSKVPLSLSVHFKLGQDVVGAPAFSKKKLFLFLFLKYFPSPYPRRISPPCHVVVVAAVAAAAAPGWVLLLLPL